MTEPQVLDAAGSSRFEIHVDDKLAGFAVYRLGHGRISFIHTEIDDAFAGQGLGGKLVRAALDAARTRGLAVIPQCPFVRGWIQKHADYLDLVPEAERAHIGL
ncbi:GNAT family N-acetyltransferase [Pseudonocardia alaniniphila]|uniref:N-acetyltransferase n=1 Tax=Pseudonocardia alaniniphila TaxID=75291 RepID=A0ABS9TIW1_9PSEU|nr:GNAT family N-acetyltransferase [Pseudonocardia alaniniphila]MCH6168423.1 N-acetyltransferase [Pseudonocardia alaniniphila]